MKESTTLNFQFGRDFPTSRQKFEPMKPRPPNTRILMPILYKGDMLQGIILAGGNGTRLKPMTSAVSKHLLPIFDKPMIFYPMTTLILAGVTEVVIVTRSRDRDAYAALFGDGSHLGISVRYAIQDEPKGIVDALLAAQHLLVSGPTWLILGDNMFFGSGVGSSLSSISATNGATAFLKQVDNPWEFGIAQMREGKIIKIHEKPADFVGSHCVTGLYLFDETVWARAESQEPSARGEYEISELLNSYLSDEQLQFSILSRGSYWLDTGTPEALHKASAFVEAIQSNQRDLVGCPEIASLNMGLVETGALHQFMSDHSDNHYSKAIRRALGG